MNREIELEWEKYDTGRNRVMVRRRNNDMERKIEK